MKLYHINPNGYGGEYFVMTDSKESALVELKRYYLKMANDETLEVRSIYKDDYDKMWASATVESLPNEYTIDEYGFNCIVETEVS